MTKLITLSVCSLLLVAAACADAPTQPSGSPPVIALFALDASRVTGNTTTTMRWEVLDKDASVRIDPSPGNVPNVGSSVVVPTSVGTFSYTLSARNAAGTSQRFVTLTVQ